MIAVRKRLIFALLFENGRFMLSRNFRLQQVGDIDWLEKNYNFRETALAIDELIVLNVERSRESLDQFFEHVKRLNDDCFVPIAAGGGIRTVEDARGLLRSGADKVVINSILHDAPAVVSELAAEFGKQCLVASIDTRRVEGVFRVFVDNGTRMIDDDLVTFLTSVLTMPIGEIYLNSMDRDGTGQGYDEDMLALVPPTISVPLILAGGAGKPEHFTVGLTDERVDAVCTAHLFNFVGNSLQLSRDHLLNEGKHLVKWDGNRLKSLAGSV
jgi:cyclase